MAAPPSSHDKAMVTYKKALATAASVTAYAVLARSMARELLPDEVRAALWWGVDFVRFRILQSRKEPERCTIVIRQDADGYKNQIYSAARAYLGIRINPRSMRRLQVSRPTGKEQKSMLITMEPGDSMTDVYEGIEFKWLSVDRESNNDKGHRRHRSSDDDDDEPQILELSFDEEHTDMALKVYLPFILVTADNIKRQERVLKIYMNEGRSWRFMNHHHPATFDTLAMNLELKRSVIDDLDRFLKRKEYYKRIGKAWKRGYLLYGPPGTGKSSLVAAMANYLKFDIYDLDLAEVCSNSGLQKLLINMTNKSILVIEDIDCTIKMRSRERCNTDADDDSDNDSGDNKNNRVTLSGLLNVIDGLWSTSGEERIIVFTTNYKDRLDPALLRPGRMDMHIYMGYCTWEAFKILASNYHLIDDHKSFPQMQRLLEEVQVTPAEIAEMLLRSDDADIALEGLVQFLKEKRNKGNQEQRDGKGVDSNENGDEKGVLLLPEEMPMKTAQVLKNGTPETME